MLLEQPEKFTAGYGATEPGAGGARQERGHWPRRYNANTATAFARFALRPHSHAPPPPPPPGLPTLPLIEPNAGRVAAADRAARGKRRARRRGASRVDDGAVRT
ncbi:unnamed protein product [Lampetra fluviatilis]